MSTGAPIIFAFMELHELNICSLIRCFLLFRAMPHRSSDAKLVELQLSDSHLTRTTNKLGSRG